MTSPTRNVTGWIEALAEGEIKLHQLPKAFSHDEAAYIRREALQRIRGMSLHTIGNYTFDAKPAKCENFIGAIQIPVGVVGPVLIKGQALCASEPVFAPLATTEGALITSVSRGCSALHAAGGAVVPSVSPVSNPASMAPSTPQSCCPTHRWAPSAVVPALARNRRPWR